MRKLRLGSPVVTAVLFVLAIGLLMGSTVGGTRAALNYVSNRYESHVEMYDIGVTLMENGKKVSWRDYGGENDRTFTEKTGVLLEHMLDNAADSKVKDELILGKQYKEELSVYNSGTIDQYVRVTVYKYWLDKDGNKLRTVSPDMIDLHFLEGNGWTIDPEATTEERTVLYYGKILPSGSETPKFTDTLTINGMVAAKVTQTTEGNVITTTYDYDGVTFQIEAKVDAVQTHNEKDAIKSAWGYNF